MAVAAAAACFLCFALCFFGAGVVAAVVAAGVVFEAAGAGDDMVDEVSAANAAPPKATAKAMAGMASFKVRIKFSLGGRADIPTGAGEEIRLEPNLLLTHG